MVEWRSEVKPCTWPSCLSEEEQTRLAESVDRDEATPFPIIDPRLLCKCTEPSGLNLMRGDQ